MFIVADAMLTHYSTQFNEVEKLLYVRESNSIESNLFLASRTALGS